MDIPRSVAAVGRRFKFPIDVKMASSPTLSSINQSVLCNYLRDIPNNSIFVTSILQVIIEERRTTHRKRWNADNSATPFEIGDVARVHL